MTDVGTAARIRAAFELSPTILSVSDLETGRLLEVNEAFVRITGWTREELIGRPIPEIGFWVDPEVRRAGLETLRGGGTVRDMEARFRKKSGEEVVALANADLVVVDGRPCVITALMDITARVRAEEALRESGRAKDEFLAMLGHELRNPLGTIVNALAVMSKGVGDGELRRFTAIIGRQTTHLSRLVDDLLDVARVTSGKIDLRRERVDLRALAHHCVDALAEAGRTQEHRVVVGGAAVAVFGDPARLEQIISNLVDNALKYTPPGGAVTITTACEDGRAVLRVRDTGEGIRSELIAHIFDLFVQQPQALDRSRGGLGLGLTLVKRLAQLHDGSVSASSAGPGQGSEFTVQLPIADTVHPSRDTAPIRDPGPRRRVLIVEDNVDARDSLQLLLQLAGHEVETAADGPGGLEKLEAFRPDVALIDLGLPGINGYDLIRRVRDLPQTQTTRFIALTGYGQAEDRRRALEAGFHVHLTKPVDPARLERLLAAG